MMAKFEVHAPLKFRKSVFTLFYSFLKVAFACALISVGLSYFGMPVPTIVVFSSLLIVSMLCICIIWHFQVVEVNGNILEIKKGFLFRERKSFSMEYIQEINVQQSIVGKYLKYGDLVITAPTIDESIVIKNLDNVKRLNRVLNDYARDQENEGFVITS